MTVIQFYVSTDRLYNGRRFFYSEFTLFGQTWWLQYWDTLRFPGANLYRGPVMSWGIGHRKP